MRNIAWGDILQKDCFVSIILVIGHRAPKKLLLARVRTNRLPEQREQPQCPRFNAHAQ